MRTALIVVSFLTACGAISTFVLTKRYATLLQVAAILLIRNQQLSTIVHHHGCAPKNDVVIEGTRHTCDQCGSTWKAEDFEVAWDDKELRARLKQSWTLAEINGKKV